MTPLQISMMLHFHCSPSPFPNWSPAASDAMEGFRSEGLVQEPVNLDCVLLTERGEAYVHFLTTLPLPASTWRIPGPWDPHLPGESIRVQAPQ